MEFGCNLNTRLPCFRQMEEVIDDIISMQSNYDDIQAYIDPIQMPNTVSRAAKPVSHFSD